MKLPIPAPELAAFAEAGVDVPTFQTYLQAHQLALIVSRDVTTRDHADHLQPYNLRISGTTHQTTGAGGKIYDVGYLQLFQADQLRSLNYGNLASIRAGRRVLAQYLHDPAVDNPSNSVSPIASVQLGADGSSAALVPARRAMTWQLTDTNGVGVVRERYWLTFAAGEIRSCTSCHGINETDQAGNPAPTNTPSALVSLLNYWKANNSLAAATTTYQQTNFFQVTFTRLPAEPGFTYHVQASTDLNDWSDIATYDGTNITISPEAEEVSRSGSPVETVTVRDTEATSGVSARFMRVKVTNP